MTRLVIAVDGPGGSGKSTVSRLLGSRLGIPHLDTGAFYRAAALVVLRAGVDPGDQEMVPSVVDAAEYRQVEGRTLIGEEDVSDEIRTEAVTAASSLVAANQQVRAGMVDRQRAWVASNGGSAVVEGRDIGTVVFPDASLKVWLDASPEERARRRAVEAGAEASLVEQSLAERDHRDSTREASPLRPADDAVLIDTTGMTAEETADLILALLEEEQAGVEVEPSR
ncbi:MAG TPA: (d)CMP kinase [Acidimicrobiia bacterium]